jgi:hypothetical protein
MDKIVVWVMIACETAMAWLFSLVGIFYYLVIKKLTRKEHGSR